MGDGDQIILIDADVLEVVDDGADRLLAGTLEAEQRDAAHILRLGHNRDDFEDGSDFGRSRRQI